MILAPNQYSSVTPFELLEAAADGIVPLDGRLLHALTDDAESSIPDLVRFGISGTGTHPIDLEEDIIAILRYLKTPQAIPFFIDCIRREPGDVSDELVEALVPLASEALEPLIALYHELEEERAGEVAFLLSSLRIRDPRLLAILLDYFEYDATDGAFCLGMYGDPAAREPLEKILAAIDPKDSEQAPLRAEILEAIDRLSEDSSGPELLPVPDLWSLYPESDEPRFDLLDRTSRLEFFSSPEASYRSAAAASFDADDDSEEVRSALLQLAREDNNTGVRAAAWQSLGDMDEDEKIHHALHEKLDDAAAPPLERAACLVSLIGEDAPEFHGYLTAFYEIPESRALALRAMWRSFDRDWAPYMIKHLEDDNPSIRREAVRGAGYLRLSSECARLRIMFDDEKIRPEALFAYAMAVPTELTPGRANHLLRNVEQAAGGLTLSEQEFVEFAIDERLAMNGMRTVFSGQEQEAQIESEEQPEQNSAKTEKVGRNEPCPCGSGKKYKKCCGK